MDISLAEAAGLLNLSPRTLRRRVAAGTISARKVGNSYTLNLRDLPLSETQRETARNSLQRMNDVLTEVLGPTAAPLQPPPAPAPQPTAQGLPAPTAQPGLAVPSASEKERASEVRPYSIRGLKVWQAGLEVVSHFQLTCEGLEAPLRTRVEPIRQSLCSALEVLANALYLYESRLKRERLEESRACFSRGLARLCVEERCLRLQAVRLAATPAEDPAALLALAVQADLTVKALETSVLPGISGLLVRLDKPRSPRRPGLEPSA